MSTTTTLDPRELFPHFYGNPAIASLAAASRWTVSGRLGEDASAKRKAPIDARALFDLGRIRGAWSRDSACLVTLDELTERLPGAANAAFYLRAGVDGLVVIDIEPDCPPEIAANLLALPGLLYTETSMSGRGYHLVTALPANYGRFPVATGKRVLREEHGWYEILIDHWCTFTRKPISEGATARAREVDLQSAPFASVEALWASLARRASVSAGAGSASVRTDADAPEIPGAAEIVQQTLDGARDRLKTPADFAGDMSRFEFSVLGTLYGELRRHLAITGFLRRTSYSSSDATWLLYRAALQVLAHRPKHNERRNGRPFLLDRAAAMVAASAPEIAKEIAA